MPRRLALSAATLSDCEPEDIIDLAADAGFSAVSLGPRVTSRPDGPPNERAAIPTDRLRALRARAERRRIDIVEVDALHLQPTTPRAEIEQAIETAVVLGAATLNIVSGYERTDELRPALAAVAARARAAGVAASLVFAPWSAPNDVIDARELVLETPHARLGVDLLHLVRAGNDVIDLLAVPHELISGAHLCDARARLSGNEVESRVESAERRLFPGSGGLPLLELVEAVPEHVPLLIKVTSARLRANLAPRQRVAWAMKSTNLLLGSPLSG